MRHVSRGEAIGLALGLIWFYPFITILVCVFAGWWGLVAYPVLVVWALVEFEYKQRQKAARWDTNE